MNQKWSLWRRRECLCLTWRGWALLWLLGFGLALLAVRNVYPFLAVNAPAPGGVLVVEGWVPDYALADAVAEFKRHHYQRLIVTGGPLGIGAPLSQYQSYAELGKAILLRLGLSTNEVEAVPAPFVPEDRTYTSALTLRLWLAQHHLPNINVNVLTLGAHARRTRLLFEKAMGNHYPIGIVALEYQGFDPNRWWKSSEGFRTVSGEVIAYGYARFFFHPRRAGDLQAEKSRDKADQRSQR